VLNYIILLLRVLKMFPSSTNASGGRWRNSQERLTHCWCAIL